MKYPDGIPRITDETVARLRSWEGRSEVLTDEVTEAPVESLCAMLDHARLASLA